MDIQNSTEWDSDQLHKEMKDIIQLAKRYATYPKLKYWCDLSACLVVGWGSLIALYSSDRLWIKAAFFIIAAFALYRAVVFTHELVHLDKKQLPYFRAFWSLFCGIPLLIPHFLYRDVHRIHHLKGAYNTTKDPEYMFFCGKKSRIILFYFENLLPPFLLLARFLILPVSILIGGEFRKKICTDASTMGPKLVFKRPLVTNAAERKYWLYEEIATCLYVWAVILLIIAHKLPASIIAVWGLLIFTILTLNTVRFMGATHLYNGKGNEMSLQEHFKDSVNILNNSILTNLLAPVGQTKHGLHHIVPFVPGLRLSELHQEIVRTLPENMLYKQMNYRSILDVLKIIWRGEPCQNNSSNELYAEQKFSTS